MALLVAHFENHFGSKKPFFVGLFLFFFFWEEKKTSILNAKKKQIENLDN